MGVRRQTVEHPFGTEAVEKRICIGRLADLRNQIAAGLQADPGTQARIACSLQQRSDTNDRDHPLDVVGQDVEAHFGADPRQGAGREVGRAHPGLDALVPASPRQSEEARRMRMLLVNRQQLLTKALDLENSARGSLKVFGLRIGTVTRRTFEARVLELVAEGRSLMANTKPMLRVRRALIEEFERLDRLCRQLARRDTLCHRLMTIPGVGTVVALTYRTGIDAPERFSRSRDVGAHFGLTPRRYSSGQTDYEGRISCCGDAMVRTALYQAANDGRWSSLRSWAMRIVKRGSVKAAKVALARRLAVVMHRMWVDGTEFRWSTVAAAASTAKATAQ